MTRINLLRNLSRGSTSYSNAGVGNAIGDFGSDQPSAVLILLKVIGMFLLPGLLIYYEQDNLKGQRAILNRLNQETQAVDAELSSKSSVAEVLKQYQQEKTRLEHQLETVRQLNKPRVRDIKALDTLQVITSTGVWLSKLIIDGKEVSITGFAINSDEMSKFMKALGESAVFSDILLTSSTEETSKSGSFKKFELHCSLEEK